MNQNNSSHPKEESGVTAESTDNTAPPYQRIYLVLNPAAGGDEPVINTINDVFHPLGIQWEVDVTHKYGDAQELARKAAEAGYDLVAGYGGDGTQHEIANGLIGTGVTMGVLPGGTGNGFCREMGLPNKLRPALEILATSHRVKNIDVVEFEDQYFIQRLYVGIEPEEQTSREMKDKYGTLAYAVTIKDRLKIKNDIHYRINIDEELIEKGDSILVHCKSGKHRSVAQAACVLIAMDYTADEAMQLIKEKRAVAPPDAWHIQRRIRKFESQWPPQ